MPEFFTEHQRMANFLAIDTSTDACSLALLRDGELSECHEIVPRQHSQRLFGMLRELLPHGRLREQGVDAVVYGEGPGSFTGLRVCASAVQGLCFAASLPAIPVSTLTAQAYTALREGLAGDGDLLLSTLDAQIGELYWSLCRVSGEHIELVEGPRVAPPHACAVGEASRELVVVGSGLVHREALPADLAARIGAAYPDLLPRARDLLPAAGRAWEAGRVLRADAVRPVYVRDEITWKKIPQQGRPD
ncbi:tRNA (adenosine(37)-N6)-threonylcarbamoyltransferase complex dimerization subunit type 1 TsaB [Parahaliea mediterranea]|uniref:tRNA threonylcarbamoyladenosine biosynthesis protein TsaB n=1 Tax=Parahaliea mediterranea TaxID=651086 RepID=A0A939DHK6_9GAMM|nr:tRNA (adenosine(37)-N6)-threonylcarbamoyltransferase complex dimerization subunit type 1 TsaB [Parahaliea mediterranea]MBN7798163.1 tRNA (adenosine(37)-N6)-threonylcarbamoyltransferase complex dimerization subunit type 1 TsaB [Parahaliea mediterranea]